MNKPIFITGIGTGVGKTVAAAIIVEALLADYWKPVQAGDENGTDSEWVTDKLSNAVSKVYPEQYKFRLAASPHLAAKAEGIEISLENIVKRCDQLLKQGRQLIVEGAGGLLVPLNNKEFVIDLLKRLGARVIIVSRNYLGSINHSLLAARLLHAEQIDVLGWIFNDQYMGYEDEIVSWSGYKLLLKIPWNNHLDRNFIQKQAEIIKPTLIREV